MADTKKNSDKRFTPEQEYSIREHYLDGMSIDDIAFCEDFSEEGVKDYLEMIGWI